jgi:hypothetical protein
MIKHTFFNENPWGVWIYAEDDQIEIGESWPHEGGTLYHGPWNDKAKYTLDHFYIQRPEYEKVFKKIIPKIDKYFKRWKEEHPSSIPVPKFEVVTEDTVVEFVKEIMPLTRAQELRFRALLDDLSCEAFSRGQDSLLEAGYTLGGC